MLWHIKRFFRNLATSSRWFIRTWDTYEYDYNYLLKVMKWKLEDMEKFFRSEWAYSRESGKCADEMKICRVLIERIIADKYADKLWDEHKEKYGDLVIELLDSGKRGIRTSQSQAESKSLRRIMLHSDYMKKQDLDYLFKIMSRKIENWWD